MADGQKSSAASTEPRKRELTEYEKGYLDGLFAGTRKVGRRMWAGTYRAEAEKYLRSIGLKGGASMFADRRRAG